MEARFRWAEAVCTYLDTQFEEADRVRLRKACPCNSGGSIAAKLSKYWRKAATVAEAVALFNAGERFASLEYVGEREVRFCYPTCYCACVKRIPRELSRTWCYCTLGNVADIFRLLLEREVETELLETIKSGGSRCVIRVSW